MGIRVMLETVAPGQMHNNVGLPHFRIRIHHIKKACLNALGRSGNPLKRPVNCHDIMTPSYQLPHYSRTEITICTSDSNFHLILPTKYL